MSTAEQRQEWRELAEQATPGEWTVEWDWQQRFNGVDAFSMGPIIMGLYEDVAPQAKADAAFIAAARAAVPALLADVERLEQERDDWHAELREALGQIDVTDAALRQCLQRNATIANERDALAAELAQYKRNAAYISSVIDSEGVYRP